MATVKDPVCGMEIDPSQAAAQSTYAGQQFYFCSRECREMFEQDPKSYVTEAAADDTQAMTERREY